MQIGELSKRSGCSVETLRYYERIGLLPKPARSGGGYRVFGEPHLDRVRFIRRCRALDFSLDEIRDLLDFVSRDDMTCAEVSRFAEEHLHRLEAKIEEFSKMQEALSRLLDDCARNRAPDCPLLDALYSKS